MTIEDQPQGTMPRTREQDSDHPASRKRLTALYRDLEQQYREVFPFIKTGTILSDDSSLAQPSPLRIVPSVAASGAFEEPMRVEVNGTDLDLIAQRRKDRRGRGSFLRRSSRHSGTTP
jgi:hypothetical protein